MRKESEIQKEILNYLEFHPDFFAFRHNVYKPQMRKKFRASKSDSGIADIICCYRGGKYVEIEVKTKLGKQSENQKEHEKKIELLGGRYFLISNILELEEMITQLYRENNVVVI